MFWTTRTGTGRGWGNRVDFVVLGFGWGALSVVVGLLARLGYPWVQRVPHNVEIKPSDLTRRVKRGRVCRAVGGVVAIAGATILFGTVAFLFFGAGDQTGLILVLVLLGLELLACLAWRWWDASDLARRPMRRVTSRNVRPAPDQVGAQTERGDEWRARSRGVSRQASRPQRFEAPVPEDDSEDASSSIAASRGV